MGLEFNWICVWLFILAYIILLIYVIKRDLKKKHGINDKKLTNPNVSDEEKQALQMSKDIRDKKVLFMPKNLIIYANLQGVFGTYADGKDFGSKLLCIEDKKLSYIEDGTGKELFSIPLEDIVNAQCDTSERLTATRILLTGVLAFALKKKTYYIVITYNDSITETEQNVVFLPSSNNDHREFINNILIARNKYLMAKKQKNSVE